MDEAKKYGLSTKVAVLSIAVLLYLQNISTPILGLMVKAFPHVSPDTVKLIQTMPQFSMMIVALLLGTIGNSIKKRTLMFIACAFLFFGGIAPMFLNDFTQIMISRAFFGVGLGISFPLASGLIGELFEGTERQKMMGLRQAIGTAAGFLFSLGSGYLGLISWKMSFLLMSVVVICFLVQLFLLPEPERKKDPVNGTPEKIKLAKWVFIISLLNIGFNVLLMTYSTNMSIVFMGDKIGPVSQVGMVTALYTLGAFVAGMIFSKVEQAFKRYTAALAVGLVGAGLLVLLLAHSVFLFFVGSFVLGIGFGSYNPCVTLKVIKSVDKNATTRAMSIYIVSQAAAQFASPLIFMYLNKAIGLTGLRATWTISAPALLISALVVAIYVLFTEKSQNTQISVKA